jgi:hypothetical protein
LTNIVGNEILYQLHAIISNEKYFNVVAIGHYDGVKIVTLCICVLYLYRAIFSYIYRPMSHDLLPGIMLSDLIPSDLIPSDLIPSDLIPSELIPSDLLLE